MAIRFNTVWKTAQTAFALAVLSCMFCPAPAQAFTIVEMKEASFSYRPAAQTEYALQRGTLPQPAQGSRRQSENSLYQALDEKFAVGEADLKAWQAQGGASPKRFRIRLKVKNYGNEASRPTPVMINLSLKTGDFLVDPDTLLVDHDYLAKTAKWQPWQTLTGTIPVLASNEWFTYFSEPIALGDYLLTLKNSYPVRLKAKILLKNGENQTCMLELPIVPDIFALDALP